MKTHELKTVPEYFRKVRNGKKTAELRLDDRDFMIGDKIILKEWKPRKKVFTGYEVPCIITDITRLAYVVPGDFDARWVMLSFDEITY